MQIYPMRDQKHAADKLLEFAHDVGAPAEIITDSANLLQGENSGFRDQARFLKVPLYGTEPGTQRQNKFEGETQVLEKR